MQIIVYLLYNSKPALWQSQMACRCRSLRNQ